MSVPRRVTVGFWLAVLGAACCLLAAGVVLDLVAVVLALTGLRGDGKKRALQTLALALLAPPAAFAFIVYVLAS